MTKRMIFSLGLACVFLAHPSFFAVSHAGTDSVRVTLESLYRLADDECTQIKLSEQQLAAAKEATQQAKNNLLPDVKVAATGSYIGDAYLMSRGFGTTGQTEVILPGLGPQYVNNGRQPTPHWGNMFSIEATQVICAGGAMVAGIKMAEYAEQVAELDVAKSKQEVRFLLTGYYLDLVKLQNQLHVIAEHIRLTEKVLEQMRAKEAVGVVLRNDLTRYELQLKQLQLTETQLRDAQSIVRHQLHTSLHRPNGVVLEPDTVSLAGEYAALEQVAAEQLWQSRASDHHIGIRQAEKAEAISGEQVHATRAASIPSLALVAKDELFGPYTNDLIPVNANVNAWFVGIGLRYDLGSLWHNHRAIRKAKGEQQVAKARTDLAREGVNNAVHAGYVHFLTSFTEVDTQQKQVQLANENYDLVSKRYANELALLTDLLDASSIKLQADIALVNARVNLLYNYYQLKYITHTL